MLTTINIENYRGFRSFCLSGLAQVNLLVGKNNCGKTALLECVHFLGSGGDPLVLTDTASRRGEVVLGSRDGPPFFDISHFFHGHDIRPGSHFDLAADNDLPSVKVEVEAVQAAEVETSTTLFEELRTSGTLLEDPRRSGPAFTLKIEGGRSRPEGSRTFPLSEDGALLLDARRPQRFYFGDERRLGPPIVFISPDLVAPGSLGGMWNQILRDKQEADVRKAMQILEADLEDIVFQTGESTYRSSFAGRAGVLVSFRGDSRRVPLGSMGDGMRRLLALSVSLIHAQGGFLIIDEIDTGFHYSIMAKMWELVVKTAVELKIQVFATTHSADCVRGLGVLCKREPLLCEKVAAHKIERNLDTNVAFTGADVLKAVEQDIEIR